MNRGVLIVILSISVFGVACGGKSPGLVEAAPPPPPAVPPTYEGSVIDSANPAEVLVNAAGRGNNTEEARLDARYSAIWVVVEGGSDPLLQTREERSRFFAIREEFYSIPAIDPYISWESQEIPSRIVTEGGVIKIAKNFKVNRRMLRDQLVLRGVLLERGDIAMTFGLPTLMVIPDVPLGENPVEMLTNDAVLKHAAQAIESYLTNRRYDVQVPEQLITISELSDAQQAIKGMDADLSYQLALSIGSDIYVTYTADVASREVGYSMVRQGVVGVRAFETTTGRLLGSETGYSEERPAAKLVVVEEAVHTAIDHVLSRIEAYWKEDLKRGVQYKLTVSIEGDFDSDQIEDIGFAMSRVIKQQCKFSKENVVADRTLDYLVWIDPDRLTDSRDLYAALRQAFRAAYPRAQLRSVNINRKLLLLKISPRNESD